MSYSQLNFDLTVLQVAYISVRIQAEPEWTFVSALGELTSIRTRLRMALLRHSTHDPDSVWNTLLAKADRFATMPEDDRGTRFAEWLAPYFEAVGEQPQEHHDWFGCFRYAIQREGPHIALHFYNADAPPKPL